MTQTRFPALPAIYFNRIAFKPKRTVALALALITCAFLATDIAAQHITAPASSAGTSLRAAVGINLSNYATQSQVSNVDNRVTTVDNRVTTVQASTQSFAWTRHFAGQMRRITGYYGDNTDVYIQQDGMIYWVYSHPGQGISNAPLGSAYAGYGDRVVIQNVAGTWAATMFHVYTQGTSVTVSPGSYGPNGVPANWGISINVPVVDNGNGNGGADF